MEKMIRAQSFLHHGSIQQGKTLERAISHRYSYSPIQFDYGRGQHLDQDGIQASYLLPISISRLFRLHMQDRYGRLDLIGTVLLHMQRLFQYGNTLLLLLPIPESMILLL